MDADAGFSSPTPTVSIFSFGRAELDEQRRELRVDGRAVAIETKPYELLRVFLHHPGETLSKDELIEAVWPGRVVTEGVLAKCVTKLRGALGDDEQQLIRTLHGYGYRWIAQLTTRPATETGFAYLSANCAVSESLVFAAAVDALDLTA